MVDDKFGNKEEELTSIINNKVGAKEEELTMMIHYKIDTKIGQLITRIDGVVKTNSETPKTAMNKNKKEEELRRKINNKVDLKVKALTVDIYMETLTEKVERNDNDN